MIQINAADFHPDMSLDEFISVYVDQKRHIGYQTTLTASFMCLAMSLKSELDVLKAEIEVLKNGRN
jgi:hypothetical protein